MIFNKRPNREVNVIINVTTSTFCMRSHQNNPMLIVGEVFPSQSKDDNFIDISYGYLRPTPPTSLDLQILWQGRVINFLFSISLDQVKFLTHSST